jgi:sporulation integral membrane protein YtvI
MRPGTRKTISLLTVFLTAWLSARYLLPLFAPFLLGTALALAAEPMTGFLSRRLHVPRPVSAGIGVSMAFCFLAMLVLLLGAFVVRQLRTLAGVLPDLEQTTRSGITMLRSWTMALAEHTPSGVRPLARENLSALFSDGAAMLDKVTGFALTFAGNLLSHIPDSALGLGTALISAFLISAKLPRIRRWFLRRIPKEKLRALLAAGNRMKHALGGWLLAQAKLMGLTLMILLLGFLLLRIPNAPVWALVVSLVDAFPVLGTGTVLLPWSLLAFLQRDTARAIGLLGIYATITLTRSLLEPKLVGRHLGLDPLATLIALYIGYKLWGIGGMILAPLLAVTALQLVPERKPGM